MEKVITKQQVEVTATGDGKGQQRTLPETAFLRGYQIFGDKKRGIQPLLPISRSTFLAGVRSGRYAITPVKLSERTTGYKVSEVKALLSQLAGEEV